MRVTTASSQGIRLLRELLAQGRYIFTVEDAAKIAKLQGIPITHLQKVLAGLAAKGWLLRLRRGLYAGTGSLLGEIKIHPFAIATHLVEHSTISHWSAMQHHGLTEQIPNIITAMTTKKVVTPTMRQHDAKKSQTKHVWKIGDLSYEYITVRQEQFFGIEEIWVDEYFKIPITDKERTLLDGFVFSRMFGGIGEILGMLEMVLPTIDVKKLIHYAVQYGKKSTIKRLGWSLEQFGIANKYLKPLLQIPVTSFSKLDSMKPSEGVYDKRWMLQNNLR